MKQYRGCHRQPLKIGHKYYCKLLSRLLQGTWCTTFGTFYTTESYIKSYQCHAQSVSVTFLQAKINISLTMSELVQLIHNSMNSLLYTGESVPSCCIRDM